MKEVKFEKLKFQIYDTVYEPQEDSFLIAKYVKNLTGRILEIGCGSGILSIINGKANPGNMIFSVDINPKAVECAEHNAKLNKVNNCFFFESNLFSNFGGKFDAIIFNPPYLPTSKEEKLKTAENHAYDGGKDGRVILDKFLKKVKKYLFKGGKLLLVQSSLNNLEKTKEILESMKFKVKTLDSQKFFFEKIYVLEAVL